MKAVSFLICFCIVFSFISLFGCDENSSDDITTEQSSESTDGYNDVSDEASADVSEAETADDSGRDSGASAHFTGDRVSLYQQLVKTPVDFSLSVHDLVCGETADLNKGFIRPGKKLTLQAKVHKDASVIAGGRVIFTLSGQTIDAVPFSMNAPDQYANVKCYYILPYYAGFDATQNGLLRFEATIEPDNLSSDTNPANNSAGTEIEVRSSDSSENDPPADATVTLLKTTSDIGDNIAIPGKPLTLKAYIGGGSGHTRVLFYVNDNLIGNQGCYISATTGASSCSNVYYVPNNYSGFLNIRVILENGSEAAITIPVETYDFQLKSNSITWDYTSPLTTAGNRISFRCNVYKDSDIPFGYSEGLRVIFVINGIQSPPIKTEASSVMSPYMGEVYYSYNVPENCTWPLQVRVIDDSGGLYNETNEENNTAEISVPASSPNGNGLSINSEDMWFYPYELIPGRTVQFFAAVHNNSTQSVMSIRVCFYINGDQLDAGNDLYNGVIRAGQYHVFQEKWTVPETLTGNPEYILTIIPGNSLSGDNISDNTATLSCQTALPDFTVSRIKAYGANGEAIFNGESADLVATVYNHGPVPAPQVIVDFRMGGEAAGSRSVSLPAYGAVEIRLPVQIPEVDDQTPASTDITGFTGHIYPGLGSGSVDLCAAADTGDLIAESDETNNDSGISVLNVSTAYQKGAVYVKVRDEGENNIQDAGVAIAAGGKTASAVTDSYGTCTFHNVPFGAYSLSVNAENYNAAYQNDYLYESNRYDYTEMFINNHSHITGVVSSAGSPLADVIVELPEINGKTETNANGEYSLTVPAGTYILKFIKNGYKRKTESAAVPAVSSAVKNTEMNTTTAAYISGYIYGTEGEPLSGMTVAAFRVNGGDLVTAVTDSEGFYSLDVPLYAPYTEDIGIRVTGRGLSKVQGLFLHRGLEHNGDLSFETSSSEEGEILSGIKGRVTPWVECASMPGTFFNPDYEVEVIYGTFYLDTFIMTSDSAITHLEIDITPDFWYYGSVSSSWSPTDLLEINNDFAAAALEVACFILPLDIPIKAGFHSSDYTEVWVKKISVISDGAEVFQTYPDQVNDFACSPGVVVNPDNCRIKYYLSTVSENDSVNPAAGYGCDHVLIEWDPKEKEFTKIGNYTPTGWDENEGHQIFTDQG